MKKITSEETSKLALLRLGRLDSLSPINAIHSSDTDDFQLLSDKIIIPSTTAVGTLVCQPITILGDTVEEEDETFTVTASVTSPNTITQPDTFTVTIVDDGDGMLEQCMVCLMNNCATIN